MRADGGIPAGGSATFQAALLKTIHRIVLPASQTEGFAPGLRPFHAALLKTIHRIVLPASPSERFESLRAQTKTRHRMVSRFVRADGGIRTLVTRRSNAFRVRPVMTASIRLHVLCRTPFSMPALLFCLLTTFLFYQTCCLSCNSQFFVCRNNHNRYFVAVVGNDSFFTVNVVLCIIDACAKVA